MPLDMKPDRKAIDKLIEIQCRKWELSRRQLASGKKSESTCQRHPIVTLSRMRGSQGRYIAEQLAKRFDYRFLDREVIDEICRVSKFRKQVIELVDNYARKEIELIDRPLLREKYIGKTNYFQHLTNVILSLSSLGGVVVLGRCASYIAKPSETFRIRIVAPVARRINNLVKFEKLTREKAMEEVRKSDKQRSDFVRKYFKKAVMGLDQYDILINTAYYDVNDAIDLAEEAMRRKFKLERK
ncbi:MAG: hypothetical protein CVT49_05240 [candidate division Zixibacteria bacterium HGW-Zixibacteria-1]|nr:MAG: hypothetical protein CVT49_05240 [candidate division Zixibacteria bacterium HGW-Zixibacteria-1]